MLEFLAFSLCVNDESMYKMMWHFSRNKEKNIYPSFFLFASSSSFKSELLIYVIWFSIPEFMISTQFSKKKKGINVLKKPERTNSNDPTQIRYYANIYKFHYLNADSSKTKR